MARPLFVSREDPEFDIMFEALFVVFGNYRCPDTGEDWQYMGTSKNQQGKLTHGFRHRSYYGERKLAEVSPSSDYLERNSSIIAEAGVN